MLLLMNVNVMLGRITTAAHRILAMMTQVKNKQIIIQTTIEQISQLKREKQYKEADRLKVVLMQKHCIQVFCRKDGTIGYAEIDEENQPIVKNIVWSLLKKIDNPFLNRSGTNAPLFIATVNLPHYRARLAKTLDCISCSRQDGTRFDPVECIDMLPLDDYPSIGVNRIVFEGWRQILLPKIIKRYETSAWNCNKESIVFIAEDDIRLFSKSYGRICNVCTNVFGENQDLDILSLGHLHATKKASRRQRRRAKRDGNCTEVLYSKSPMLQHLSNGGKVHGSTFLALRYPRGVKALLNSMESVPLGKRGHFDQFLFHSTDQELGIAFSDPPLAGWAEVEETLTAVGSGFRREGGGRLENHVNSEQILGEINWIRRNVVG